jgi:predicted nucleic acid-binding protein
VLNLARIGRLELLPLLYQQVVIPTAVYAELTDPQCGLPPAIDLGSAPGLTVAMPKDQGRVRALREDLDLGEAEAIVLATECHADLLLVDERRGRRIAATLGPTVTGLLGVLADAKKAGFIERAKPVLDQLIQEARFWIGPDLYSEFLAGLDED